MTASPSNIILSKGTYQVTIATTDLELNWTKSLTIFNSPTSTEGQEGADDNSNTSKIVDLLLKTEKRISVDGFITENYGTGDTHDTAYEKKEDLRNIMYKGGVSTMTCEGSAYSGNIEKISVKWGASDSYYITKYSVKFTFVEGDDAS